MGFKRFLIVCVAFSLVFVAICMGFKASVSELYCFYNVFKRYHLKTHANSMQVLLTALKTMQIAAITRCSSCGYSC